MTLAGEGERLLERRPVQGLGGIVDVLLQDGEQVAEERPLVGVQAFRVLIVGQGDRFDLGRANPRVADRGFGLDGLR